MYPKGFIRILWQIQPDCSWPVPGLGVFDGLFTNCRAVVLDARLLRRDFVQIKPESGQFFAALAESKPGADPAG